MSRASEDQRREDLDERRQAAQELSCACAPFIGEDHLLRADIARIVAAAEKVGLLNGIDAQAEYDEIVRRRGNNNDQIKPEIWIAIDRIYRSAFNEKTSSRKAEPVVRALMLQADVSGIDLPSPDRLRKHFDGLREGLWDKVYRMQRNMPALSSGSAEAAAVIRAKLISIGSPVAALPTVEEIEKYLLEG